MSLLVTGSIGIDTVETPAGRRDNVLGGSAVYFSYAASFFSPVRLVGVVGEDWPATLLSVLDGRPIDLTGLEKRAGSKSFRWHGSYVENLNDAVTVEVDLNVLAERAPKIPAAFGDSKFLFLANTHPALQQQMLKSVSKPQLVVADTMNLWITTARPEVVNLLKQIDGIVLNDGEARLLTEERNVVSAAKKVLALSEGRLKFVVVKKGEHGAVVATPGEVAAFPAFPTEAVVDPTGAGDSFAGGLMGYLATQPAYDMAGLRRAVAYGTVTASFTISDFSLAGLAGATREKVEARLSQYRAAVGF